MVANIGYTWVVPFPLIMPKAWYKGHYFKWTLAMWTILSNRVKLLNRDWSPSQMCMVILNQFNVFVSFTLS